MRARSGDRIRLRRRSPGQADRIGQVLATRGVNGEPPFVLRWEGSDTTSFFRPGFDAELVPAGEAVTGGDGPSSATSVVALDLEECRALLALATVGRLGVVVDGRPEIFPVCHVYDGGAVAFPTTDGTKARAALSDAPVVFEVDGIEDGGLTGWSVVVKGRVHRVADPDEAGAYADERTAPWRRGPSTFWLRLVPEEVTGRRFEARPAGPRIR